ncbi:MAG: preprotein translocase subunit SecE [Minisyncoccota bacterium]
MSLIQYIKETQVEIKHVNWPTRNQTIVFSIVVILVSFGVAFFLGLFDYIFKIVLEKFILQ